MERRRVRLGASLFANLKLSQGRRNVKYTPMHWHQAKRRDDDAYQSGCVRACVVPALEPIDINAVHIQTRPLLEAWKDFGPPTTWKWSVYLNLKTYPTSREGSHWQRYTPWTRYRLSRKHSSCRLLDLVNIRSRGYPTR